MSLKEMEQEEINNSRWSAQLVEELLQCGVSRYFLAPGLRSAALAKAVVDKKGVSVTSHFDERGVAFAALGYGRAAAQPAAVICTSGTAVLNMLPAIAEADSARIPLVLLSADRPMELRKSGERQTLDQLSALKPYLRDQVDLPAAGSGMSVQRLMTVIDRSCYAAKHPVPGPVQINLQFREPIIQELDSQEVVSRSRPFTVYSELQMQPDRSALERLRLAIEQSQRGLVVVGELSPNAEYSALIGFLAELNWPVMADVTSPIRYSSELPNLLRNYDLYIERGDLDADCILQFGDYPVSKTLQEWISRSSANHLLVHEHPYRQDRDLTVVERFIGGVGLIAKELLSEEIVSNSELLAPLKTEQQRARSIISEVSEQQNEISEIEVIQKIYSAAPANTAVFLASSLPIREADRFVISSGGVTCSSSNRGVMGIDGTIATAAGFGLAHSGMTVAIVGDLAFLHDLNSLLIVKKSAKPELIVLLNNDGGAIFSMLPVAEQFGSGYQEMMQLSHGLKSVEGIVSSFGLSYRSIESLTDIEECFRLAKDRSAVPIVLELRSSNQSVKQRHLQYQRAIQE